MWLGCYALVVLFIPLWGVPDIILSVRLSVTIILLVSVVSMLGVAHVAPKTASSESNEKSIIFPPKMKMFFAAVWLAATCCATAATYARADMPFFGPVLAGLSQVGEALFPVIAKYRTDLNLSEPMLFRVQGVDSSICLAALALMAVLNLRLLLFKPEQKALLAGEVAKNIHSPYADKRSPPLISMVVVSLICLAAYAGWFSFADVDVVRPRGCLVIANCYATKHGIELLVAALLNSLLAVWTPMFLLHYMIVRHIIRAAP